MSESLLSHSRSPSSVSSGTTNEWVSQQVKAFTHWINNYLSLKNDDSLLVTNLHTDLNDGIRLINLIDILEFELISDPNAEYKETFHRYQKKPKYELQRTENIELVLKFLRDKGFALVGITASSIEQS